MLSTKKHLFLFLFLFTFLFGLKANTDSLYQTWKDSSLPDSSRLKAAQKFTESQIQYMSLDSALLISEEYLDFALEKKDTYHQGYALIYQGQAFFDGEQPSLALDKYNQGLTLFKEIGASLPISETLGLIATTYSEQRLLLKAVEYFQQSLKIQEEMGLLDKSTSIINNIGNIFVKLGNYDQALIYYNRSLSIKRNLPDQERNIVRILNNICGIYSRKGNFEKALELSTEALEISEEIDFESGKIFSYHMMGFIHDDKGDYDKALQYYQDELEISQKRGKRPSGVLISIAGTQEKLGNINASIRLCEEVYQKAEKNRNLRLKRLACNCLFRGAKEKGEWEKALGYYELITQINDSVNKASYDRDINQRVYQYEYEKQKEIDQLTFESEIQARNLGLVITTVGLIGIFLIAFFQYRAKKEKEKLLVKIQDKNDTIVRTQDQLIVQEKMASLGKLTVGIAHEIKNPLNFVNNFAESSVEIANELEEELKELLISRPEAERAIITELLGEVKEHVKLIKQEGIRADKIITGMMSHASDDSGEKAETNINYLVDIQTDLLFQSSGKNSNIEITRHFDESLPIIYSHPQEISRVLFNILKNAQFAVEKKSESSDDSYQPQIDVYTQQEKGGLLIRIRDNGIGIPPNIRSQIFEPFFTTKPTGGENTGLGLSISYDIITQGLQGDIEVESEEGTFTEFRIIIPINKN